VNFAPNLSGNLLQFANMRSHCSRTVLEEGSFPDNVRHVGTGLLQKPRQTAFLMRAESHIFEVDG
jgi:hypothetical protein